MQAKPPPDSSSDDDDLVVDTSPSVCRRQFMSQAHVDQLTAPAPGAGPDEMESVQDAAASLRLVMQLAAASREVLLSSDQDAANEAAAASCY